ncbi:MAG: DUF1761 domain-containing protein [Salinispira sp.]
MDIMSMLSIKWWALLIGVGISFIIGMLWYGPIFGRQWMKLIGITPESIQDGGSPLVYVGSLLTSLITIYGLGIVLNLINSQNICSAIAAGLLLWFSFYLAPTINHYSYESRPSKLLLINCFYDFVFIILVSIVLQLAR